MGGSLKKIMTCFSFMRDTVRQLRRQMAGLGPEEWATPGGVP